MPGGTDVGTAGRSVAVVTGASRGIGAMLSQGFAAAGYLVAGCSRTGTAPGRGDQLLSRTSTVPPGTAGPADSADTVSMAAVDVTDLAGVRRFVDGVIAEYRRIDVLVNCAGLIEAEGPLWEADPDQWWRVVEVNVRGPFLMCHSVVPHMLRAGGGRVINLNSGAGTASRPDLTAYCAGKSALGRITGGLHLAGFDRGLRAFDLAPGVVATDMTAGMASHRGRTDWTDPRDVVDLALALASGDLDAWSGRMVRAGVDGPEALRERTRVGLTDDARTVGLIPWGPDDPLA